MEERENIGITKMTLVIIIAAIIIIASVGTAGWWFYLRPAEKKECTIDLALYSKVPVNETQTVSGSLDPAVADATITLTFTKPDDSTFNVTVTSASGGSFTYAFVVAVLGNWTAQASWPGNNEFKEATSSEKTFEVIELEGTLINCFVQPSEVERGEDATITGQIWTNVTGGGAGVTVTLTFTRTDDSTFNRTTTSASDSSFNYTYTSQTTDVVGLWKVTASWAVTETEEVVSEPAPFYIVPVFTGEPIKIGAVGPIEWIQGEGIEEAAKLAASEINVAGGVLNRKLVIVTGDEGFEPTVGVASMEKLITIYDVDFVVGGFRTEIVFPMRDKAMDHQKIFMITGATTNELLDCTGSLTTPFCGHCISCNYDRYKYLFRVMPINTTAIFSKTLVPYIRYHVIPNVLNGGPEKKVKVGVLVENLVAWDLVWNFVNFMPSVFTGPYGQIVYTARPSHTEDDFTTYLSKIRDEGVELIIHIFSAEAGLAFVKQWAEMEIPAIPVGVNVLSQESRMWTDTEGKCEYEAFLSTPPRVPLSNKTIPFWDSYVERWGHDPIYTSFGTYDAIYILAEAVEKAGTIDSDAVVAELEKTNRMGIIGRFKFTEFHDVYCPTLYEGVGEPPTGTFHWKTPEEYGDWVVPMVVQWQNGTKECVFPFDRPYTKEHKLPPFMQP
jgi:branched-chain amino acid transport system substrate-binding protein